MMLGKRSRRSITRTTSLTRIDLELYEPSDRGDLNENDGGGGVAGVGSAAYDPSCMAMVSPRCHRKTRDDRMDTVYFMGTCGLCRRRLAPGRDIFMYRGDAAFCSQECREQQMKHDEAREKFFVAASKKDDHHSGPELKGTSTA